MGHPAPTPRAKSALEAPRTSSLAQQKGAARPQPGRSSPASSCWVSQFPPLQIPVSPVGTRPGPAWRQAPAGSFPRCCPRRREQGQSGHGVQRDGQKVSGPESASAGGWDGQNRACRGGRALTLQPFTLPTPTGCWVPSAGGFPMGHPAPAPPQGLGMWLSLGHSRRRDVLTEGLSVGCSPQLLEPPPSPRALQGAPGCRDPFPSCPRCTPQRPQPRGSGEPKGRSKPSRCLPALGPIPLASSLPRSDGGRRPAPPARQVEQGWGQAAGTRRALPCPIAPCQALLQHRDARSRAPEQHCHPKGHPGGKPGGCGARIPCSRGCYPRRVALL